METMLNHLYEQLAAKGFLNAANAFAARELTPNELDLVNGGWGCPRMPSPDDYCQITFTETHVQTNIPT